MRYCIVNGSGDRFTEAADRFERKLRSFGIETGRDPYDGEYDALFAVGGDGTILDASSDAVALEIPICGINAGRVGFLAAFDEADIDTMEADFFDKLYLSERDLLCVSINGGPYEDIALNDFVFFKKDICKTVEINLFTDEKKLATYRCDGIIVSTATGSTAYTLSAGGPVILPDVAATVITPICAHTTAQHSLVVPLDTCIRVTMSDRNEEVAVIADGQDVGELKRLESASVTRYARKLKLMLSEKRDVYELLSGTTGG
ncbi:MAG: NAD(+)/NADH kinase [Oscillospiraceae bacterium]|nr:NAD(+)/NADH kinase [Oscillospiraceae bacterium]